MALLDLLRRKPANAAQNVPASLRNLREQIERQKLELESRRLALHLSEAVTDSVFGTPINFEAINSYNGQPLIPLFFRDMYQSKTATLRFQQQFDRARQLARYAYETNENARAAVLGLCNYVVGSGYSHRIAAKDRDQEESLAETIRRAEKIIDEFVEVNELKDSADGCPGYDEAFTRGEVEGEIFVRLYPDEIETTRLRFVEPDNIRPPKGENAEGPWAFGILTHGQPEGGGYGENIAWDTQTPRGYNINYPLIDKDEPVEPQFIFHLKRNVKKNQKRGISSLYCPDETLRGVQKLRYAAREGAKIRASIPYAREHAQADADIITTLQSGVITAEAPRTDSNGQQYTVPVQQIEPGSVPDIPASLKMVPAPPDPNAEGVEANLRHGLETIAACLSVPAWLVGGSSSNASYADGLVKESPFLKNIVRQQRAHTGFWARVFTAVLEIAEEQGRLPEGASKQVVVSVIASDPQVRNELERQEANEKLYDRGGLSLHTLIHESGHDPEEELGRRQKEREEGLEANPPADAGGPQGQGQGREQEDGDELANQRRRDEGGAVQEAAMEAFAAGAVNALINFTEQDDGGGGKSQGSKGKGHWITIGGGEEGGGVHVFIGKNGKIAAGPKELLGKDVGNLRHHVSGEGQGKLPLKGTNKPPKPTKPKAEKADKPQHVTLNPKTRVGKAILSTAADYGVEPEHLAEAVQFIHKEKADQARERELAKAHARQLTGLTAGDLARVENGGGDWTSRIGGKTGGKMRFFDEYAQEIAREHPGLIGDADDPNADHGANLWSLLREGKQDIPALDDPDILREAASMVSHYQRQEKEAGELVGAGVEDDF